MIDAMRHSTMTSEVKVDIAKAASLPAPAKTDFEEAMSMEAELTVSCDDEAEARLQEEAKAAGVELIPVEEVQKEKSDLFTEEELSSEPVALKDNMLKGKQRRGLMI